MSTSVEDKKPKAKNQSKLGDGSPYFSDDQVQYSAFSRCICGAGLARVKKAGDRAPWQCSEILTGRKTSSGNGYDHSGVNFGLAPDSVLPEGMPSLEWATTRVQNG